MQQKLEIWNLTRLESFPLLSTGENPSVKMEEKNTFYWRWINKNRKIKTDIFGY